MATNVASHPPPPTLYVPKLILANIIWNAQIPIPSPPTLLGMIFLYPFQSIYWKIFSSTHRLFWENHSAHYFLNAQNDQLVPFGQNFHFKIKKGSSCCVAFDVFNFFLINYLFLIELYIEGGFLECRPLAGEYPAKRLCVVRPALGAYISGTRLVRGIIPWPAAAAIALPLEGWVSIS